MKRIITCGFFLCWAASSFGGYTGNPYPSALSGGNTHDWWFVPQSGTLAREDSVANTSTITNYEDIITFDQETTPLTYDLAYDIVVSGAVETVTFFPADGFFEVDENTGHAVSQRDGEGEIIFRSPSLERRLTLTASTTLPGELGCKEDLSAHVYLDNTVKKHINETFAARVAGHSGSDEDCAIYSTQDHANAIYVRNTTGWTAGLDLTCCSPWNSTGDPGAASRTGLPSGQFRAATAITSRHLLSSNHYHLRQTFAGSDTSFLVRFVDADNNVYERTCIAHAPLSGGDSVVLRLDSDLPASITPAKRLPADWGDYMPYTRGFLNELNDKRYNENFPLVLTDQEERATIGESFNMGFGGAASYQPQYGGYLSSWAFDPLTPSKVCFEQRTTYARFYRDKIVGDSSSPILLYINGEPVITATLTYGGGGSGSPLSNADYAAEVQAAINAWGDPHTWEAIDLSGFRSFNRID